MLFELDKNLTINFGAIAAIETKKDLSGVTTITLYLAGQAKPFELNPAQTKMLQQRLEQLAEIARRQQFGMGN